MANRIVRSIRNVKDIEKQPFHTNEINDLIHTEDDKIYIRKNRSFEEITGLDKVKDDVTKHGQRLKSVESENAEQRESIQNINETLETRKVHIDDLKALKNKVDSITGNTSEDENDNVEYVPQQTFDEFTENINTRINEMFSTIQNEEIAKIKERLDALENDGGN